MHAQDTSIDTESARPHVIQNDKSRWFKTIIQKYFWIYLLIWLKCFKGCLEYANQCGHAMILYLVAMVVKIKSFPFPVSYSNGCSACFLCNLCLTFNLVQTWMVGY